MERSGSMPPKAKVTKEDIITAAVDIIRKDGEQNLNARTVAASLGCSTQPVFSNYATMDELKADIVERAYGIYQQCLQKEIESGKYPPYKASGIGYIRFAGEEKELFKLLFMRERSKDGQGADHAWNSVIGAVQKATDFDKEQAELFHLEIWASVHGIASMIATSYLDWDFELISQVLTDLFFGIKHQFDARLGKEHTNESN